MAAKIAICFFGITRSLSYTQASIKKNIIHPLAELGEIKCFAHFFDQKNIANYRSGEFGSLNQSEHKLLPLDELQLCPPNSNEVVALYEGVKKFGAGWGEDYDTLKNLCHQLISLRTVTEMALHFSPDICVFLRPDLMYHDDFSEWAVKSLEAEYPTAFVPEWQSHGGCNDRFCIAKGEAAIRAYGSRAHRALEYCQSHESALPAELLVEYALHEVSVEKIDLRATRIRFDGTYRKESFDKPEVALLVNRIRQTIRHGGVRDTIITILRMWQAVRYSPRYRGLNYRSLNGIARRDKARNLVDVSTIPSSD